MGDVHAHALPPSGTQSHARCPAVRPGAEVPDRSPLLSGNARRTCRPRNGERGSAQAAAPRTGRASGRSRPRSALRWRHFCSLDRHGLEVRQMTSLGLLLLRLVMGGLLVGHGSQKVYGMFGGHGPYGTGQRFENVGLRPGPLWARIGGSAEMTGGALTALGLLSPLGPLTTMAPMIVAGAQGHRGKPIWVPPGGAELPATNLAIAGALVLAGPGAVSIHRGWGTRPPWWLSLLVITGLSTGVVVALQREIHEAAERVRAEELREQAEPKRVEAADVEPEVVLSNYSN